MDIKYFLIENGSSTGPFTFEELKGKNINKESMVWHEGLTDWKKAGEVPALVPLFEPVANPGTPPPHASMNTGVPEYYAMINGIQVGPMAPALLVQNGMTPSTMVWCAGLPDWVPAYTRSELSPYFNSTANLNSAASGYNPGGYNSNPYRPANGIHYQSMMGMAIAATILSFLFSCIGMIFGIIAIVNANKAKDAYLLGDEVNMDLYNGKAKTNSIIAFVLAGIGFFVSLFVIGNL